MGFVCSYTYQWRSGLQGSPGPRWEVSVISVCVARAAKHQKNPNLRSEHVANMFTRMPPQSPMHKPHGSFPSPLS